MKWAQVLQILAAAFAIASCALQGVPPDANRVAECMMGVLKSIPETQSIRLARAAADSGAVLMIEYSFLDQTGQPHRNRIGLNKDLYEGKDHWFFWSNELTSLDEDPGRKVMMLMQWWTTCGVDTAILA